MSKFHPGSGICLDLTRISEENEGKTKRNPRNSGSKFLRAYFLSIFLFDGYLPACRYFLDFEISDFLSESSPSDDSKNQLLNITLNFVKSSLIDLIT